MTDDPVAFGTHRPPAGGPPRRRIRNRASRRRRKRAGRGRLLMERQGRAATAQA